MLKDFKELFKYRVLIWTLVVKQLKVRYRGSILGFLWSFLNPLLLMIVYALVFLVYMRISMENYTVYMFCGLLPWIWFSSSLIEGTSSIVLGGNLITKSMFPAEVLPMVSVITNLINYLLGLPMLFLFIILFKVKIGMSLFAFPIVVFIQFFFTYGLVLGCSSLNVHFRDVQHLIANFITLWFFLCPIIYPVSQIPERFRFTLYANPMAVITMAYNDIFFYHRFPNWKALALVLIVSLFVYIVGNNIFEKYRDTFAEEV